MTARGARRYPCPGCGSFKGTARETWNHILKAHRIRLIEGLGLIEAFGTRKPLDPPRTVLQQGSGSGTGDSPSTFLNPGVSGEGDS